MIAMNVCDDVCMCVCERMLVVFLVGSSKHSTLCLWTDEM